MSHEFTPGIYEVISTVTIRREPRIVEYQDEHGKLVSNGKGILSVGTIRAIYGVVTNKDNTTWGRVSLYDSAGISEWVCIKGLNREYMRFREPLSPELGIPAPEQPVTRVEFDHLVKWAKIQGYKPE